MTIGERIATARKNAGLTQDELAKRMNMPYQTIGHWEHNMSSPKFSSLEKLTDALGINIETLICGKTAEGTIKENPVPDEPPKYLFFLEKVLQKTIETKTSLDLYMALRNINKGSEDAEVLNNIHNRLIDNIADILNLYVDAQHQ